MTKLEIFKAMMTKAKAGGYIGSDYKYNIGYILDGDNINVLIFKKDFIKSVLGYRNSLFDKSGWKVEFKRMVGAENKWKYIEENIL